MTYKRASELLVGRCAKQRSLVNRTKIFRDGDNDNINVTKYKSHTVTLRPDGSITMMFGGGYIGNRTTINDFLPAGWYVYQQSRHWCLYHYKDAYPGDKWSFKDGITLHADGSVTGEDPTPFEDKVKAHRKSIRDRNKMVKVDGSIYGFVPGEVVFKEKNNDYSWCPAITDSTRYKIVSIFKNSNGREKLRLKPVGGGTSILIKPYCWSYKLTKDVFLSAAVKVKQAGRR